MMQKLTRLDRCKSLNEFLCTNVDSMRSLQLAISKLECDKAVTTARVEGRAEPGQASDRGLTIYIECNSVT